MNIEERIDKYLEGQHATLWGQFFEIHSTKGRKQAKEFLLDILIDMGITHEDIE